MIDAPCASAGSTQSVIFRSVLPGIGLLWGMGSAHGDVADALQLVRGMGAVAHSWSPRTTVWQVWPMYLYTLSSRYDMTDGHAR